MGELGALYVTASLVTNEAVQSMNMAILFESGLLRCGAPRNDDFDSFV